MNGSELRELLPGAIAFFEVDNYPGVILSDKQGWLFDGDVMPRPITRTEAKEKGAYTINVDEAAELFSLRPSALDFLKKKNFNNSTIPTNRATTTAGGQLKARVVEKRKE